MIGENIDKICAEVGFSIPQKDIDKSKQENVIRKALGVLSSDGIFAYVIWTESKAGQIKWNEKRLLTPAIAGELRNDILEKIFSGVKGENPDLEWNQRRENFRQELTKAEGILTDIYKMFLVKQLFERILTYALYRAKSLE